MSDIHLLCRDQAEQRDAGIPPASWCPCGNELLYWERWVSTLHTMQLCIYIIGIVKHGKVMSVFEANMHSVWSFSCVLAFISFLIP